MIYKTFKRKGQTYYLIKKQDIQAELNYISWTQTQTNLFRNIQIKPYKGHKYNKNMFCYLIEG